MTSLPGRATTTRQDQGGGHCCWSLHQHHRAWREEAHVVELRKRTGNYLNLLVCRKKQHQNKSSSTSTSTSSTTTTTRQRNHSRNLEISSPYTTQHRPTTICNNKLLLARCCLYILLPALMIFQESRAGPMPGGFLDSGRPIACAIGKPIDISDHIPFSDPNLSRCYSCSCPNGSVQCGRSADPDCSVKAPPSSKKMSGASSSPASGASPTSNNNNKHPTITSNKLSNRVSPTTTLLMGHHHSHHHVANQKSHSGSGKPKPIGVPRQPKSGGGGGLSGQAPSAAALVQQPQRQQQQKSAGKVQSGARTRHQHYKTPPTDGPEEPEEDEEAEEEEAEAEADETPSAGGGRKSNENTSSSSKSIRVKGAPKTPRPYLDEILKTPTLPLDDPRHHSIAAAAMNFDGFLQKREKHLLTLAKMKSASGARQSHETATTTTTPAATTTTGAPPTTTSELPADQDGTSLEPLLPEDNFEDEDQVQATTTRLPTTLLEQVTTESPVTASTSVGEWPSGETTETPISVPGQPIDGPERPGFAIESNTSPSDPAAELSERGIGAILTRLDNKPPVGDIQQDVVSRTPTGDDNNNDNNNNNVNQIDYNSANEIMEQVSHDGMLYIAIGVEAFILLTILAMMTLFYIFREKTTDDGEFNSSSSRLNQHQALQLPRRSPSLEKA